MTGIQSQFVCIQGRDIHYLERAGDSTNAPTVVFLHGFPENAHAWESVITHLPAAYRIVAPDLPGYHLSAPLSEVTDYQVPQLISRMSAFIKKINRGKPVILVGHDWGGAIAWPLAAFHSTLVNKLVILNAAHPSTFTQALINSSSQRQKSQYIHTLVSDDAQNMLTSSNYRLFREMLGETLFAADNPYGKTLLEGWANADSLDAMLNYYRQMPQQVPLDNPTNEQLSLIKVPDIRITIPTLVLWGRQDDAFDECILDGLENYVTQLSVHYHNHATHWIHREQAEWVAQHLLRFLTDL